MINWYNKLGGRMRQRVPSFLVIWLKINLQRSSYISTEPIQLNSLESEANNQKGNWEFHRNFDQNRVAQSKLWPQTNSKTPELEGKGLPLSPQPLMWSAWFGRLGMIMMPCCFQFQRKRDALGECRPWESNSFKHSLLISKAKSTAKSV